MIRHPGMTVRVPWLTFRGDHSTTGTRIKQASYVNNMALQYCEEKIQNIWDERTKGRTLHVGPWATV